MSDRVYRGPRILVLVLTLTAICGLLGLLVVTW